MFARGATSLHLNFCKFSMWKRARHAMCRLQRVELPRTTLISQPVLPAITKEFALSNISPLERSLWGQASRSNLSFRASPLVWEALRGVQHHSSVIISGNASLEMSCLTGRACLPEPFHGSHFAKRMLSTAAGNSEEPLPACWNCGATIAGHVAYFCPECEAIQPPNASLNYYTLMGMCVPYLCAWPANHSDEGVLLHHCQSFGNNGETGCFATEICLGWTCYTLDMLHTGYTVSTGLWGSCRMRPRRWRVRVAGSVM
jgi:hypothetical protein